MRWNVTTFMQEGSGNAAASLPKGFPVILMHDLADCCQVGEAVEVTGALLLQLQGSVASGALAFACGNSLQRSRHRCHVCYFHL